MSLALLYGGSQYDYGDAEFGGTRLAEILNRKENYFDFVTYFQPNSRVRFFLDGQYGTYTFTEVASNFKDTRSYGAFCGLEFIPRTGETRRVAGVQGSISLGYKRFDVIDPQFVDASGFVGPSSPGISNFRLTPTPPSTPRRPTEEELRGFSQEGHPFRMIFFLIAAHTPTTRWAAAFSKTSTTVIRRTCSA
jgi:hypothetical protein